MNVPTRKRTTVSSRNASSFLAGLEARTAPPGRASSSRRVVSRRASAPLWLLATALNSRFPEPKCRKSSSVQPNAGSSGCPATRVGRRHLQVGEDRHQQVVLVEEVRVEGRPPDVGPIDDVLDGHGLVAPLEDQVGERLLQRPPRPRDPSIRPRSPTVVAPDRHGTSPRSRTVARGPFRIEQPAPACRLTCST